MNSPELTGHAKIDLLIFKFFQHCYFPFEELSVSATGRHDAHLSLIQEVAITVR